METFSILICALNEEKNIKNIISKCFSAEKNQNYTLEKIIVVSDGSTDKTNEIVWNLQKNYSNIELIIYSERQGKAWALNIGKSKINSDWLVSLDADINISKNLFLEIFDNITPDIWLIGWNPIPKWWKKTIAEKVSFFSYKLVEEIKLQIQNWDNFYSAHGRCLTLSKEIYTNISLPNSAGTDQFMYFYTLKQWKKFKFQKNAEVYYTLPKVINDYTKQNIRFQKTQKVMEEYFWVEFVKNEKQILKNIKIKSLFLSFISCPVDWFLWGIIFSYGKIKSYFSQAQNGKWEVSSSTK